MADLAALVLSASSWQLGLAAAILAAAGFAWLQFRKARSLQHLLDFDRRLKDLMNKAPVGIVAYRKRALVYANEACLRLLAVPSVEELSKRNPMDFFAPHERERIMGYIAARETGQPAPSGYEVDALRATGESFPMTVRISQADLNDGPAVLMFIEDATERVSTRNALQKSEREYRGLFEAAHDAILIFEPADERILDANERACQMYGLPRQELVGRSLLEFSTDAATGRKRIEDMRAEGVLAGFQTVHRRHDGTRISLDVNASIVEYKGREAVLSIHRDITQRLGAEAALRRSEENYRLLVENQTELVVKVDREGRFLFVSPSYCELFGKQETDLLGKALLPPVHEEDQGATLKAMKALDLWPNTAYVEQRVLTTKGWRWIAWNYRAVLSSEGRLDAVVGIGRDVTERRASEDALRESEQIFRALAESSSVTIAIYQGQNLVYINPSAEKLSGYTASELAGMPLTRLMHPDYRDLLVKRAQARQRGEPVLSQYEAPLLRKDGGTRWLLVSAARITYKGEPAGLITAFDVTERRSIEEALRQSAHEIQSIFKALPDLYFRMDSDGKILEWRSGRDEDLFLRPEQFLGRRMQDVMPPDAAAKISRAFREVQGGASTAAAEYSLPMPGGEKAFEARLAPLFQDQIVAVVRNVTERRRAQERLRSSEARYRMLMETANDAIFVADALTGMLVDANLRAQNLIGRDLDEICAMHQTELHPPAERERYATVFQDHISRGVAIAEDILLMHRDGHLIPAEVSAALFEVDGRQFVQGIFRDITERRLAQAALIESEARLRKIIEQSPLSMAIVAMDGTIEYINRWAIDTFGYEREDIPNMDRWWVLAYPEEGYRKEVIATWMGLVERAIALNHEIEGREYEVTCKDGSVKTVLIFGVPVANKVFVMFQDVTERKRAEEALRAQVERHRALVENARAIILQFDPNLTITYWNDYAAEFFGFAREEALGANLLDTVVPRTDTSGRNLEVMIRDIALDPNRYAANINENLTKDGRRVWVAWSNRPMVDAHGRLEGVLSIGTDITELKRAEAELRLTNRQLLAVAASTQAMGQFADVKTAMRSICEAAIGAFGATMAWVGMIVPESTEVTPLASAGRDEGYTDKVRVRWDLSPRSMGPAGRALKTRKPQIMSVDDPDFAPWREEAVKRGFRVVCALPLTQGEEVRGVITLYTEDPAVFNPESFEILEIFAGQCAMVLVNAALYDEARRTIEELWKANEEFKKG
jgi:PAS domain S-box-containing protein